MDKFGKRLAYVRATRRFSVYDLANKIKISPKTLYAYERGKHNPAGIILRDLCKALNISADYLLGIRELTEREKADLLSRNR